MFDPGSTMELSRSCIPTTIVALRRYPGFNDPAVVVHLVGRVVNESVGYIFHDLTLDDATERIGVRFIHSCSHPRERTRLLGTYVSVFGRLSASVPTHIVAYSLHTAVPDEVSFHIIEVGHTFLTLSQNYSQDGTPR